MKLEGRNEADQKNRDTPKGSQGREMTSLFQTTVPFAQNDDSNPLPGLLGKFNDMYFMKSPAPSKSKDHQCQVQAWLSGTEPQTQEGEQKPSQGGVSPVLPEKYLAQGYK